MAGKAYAQQYAAQVKRIRQFIRNNVAKGYQFDMDWINAKLKAPKKPTQASVNKLDKIRPEQLFAKATWTNPATGEIIDANRHRTELRIIAAQKAVSTRQARQQERTTPQMDYATAVIARFRGEFDRFTSKRATGKSIILDKVDKMIDEYGIGPVARAIIEWESDGLVNFAEIAYKDEEANKAGSQILAKIHKMTGATPAEIIADQQAITEEYDEQNSDLHYVEGV